MNMHKVSVIIPTYNREHVLSEAINSVLFQTFHDFEIIVVDDGSSDNTKDVVTEYIKKYSDKIKYLYQQNKGPAAARNTGIKEAQGEYVAFLDNDDLWDARKLQKQVNWLNLHLDYAMVYCDYAAMQDSRVLSAAYIQKYDRKFAGSGRIYNNLLKRCFIMTPSVMARRNVLLEMGAFRESLQIHEDYDLWLRIARKYPIGFINEPLFQRRQSVDGASRNAQLYYTLGIKLFSELFMDKTHTIEETHIIRAHLATLYFDLGYLFWDANNLIEAKRNFKAAFKIKHLFLKSLIYYYLCTTRMATSRRQIEKCPKSA